MFLADKNKCIFVKIMMRNKNILFFALLFFSLLTIAQKPKKIELLGADILKGGGVLGKDVKRLIGNVRFKHSNAIMYCDSAHFNVKQNVLDAYSNVHIEQKNDTLDLYSDYLNYNGDTKMAIVRNNVKLTHGDAILITDSLNFDRNINLAYYFSGGEITDPENKLTSINGYYYTNEKNYVAIDSVVLINKDYTMYSDTLKYNTETDISYFFGPTKIISDSDFIYCENGWYDTHNDISQFNENAYLQKKNNIIKGDSLYYDRISGLGKAFKNVEIIDTTQKITIKGNIAYYYEQSDNALVTDSAVLEQVNDTDTLFVHGDTLQVITYKDTIVNIFTDTIVNTLRLDSIISNINDTAISFTIDTLVFYPDSTDSTKTQNKYILSQKKDSVYTYKKAFVYHKVRIYKSDLQAKADSLVYNMKDSVLKMFIEPIVWSDENQISAEYIEFYLKNNQADYFYLKSKAIIISKDDSIRFNQISGKEIYGYFKDNEVYKLKIVGNAESVYYAREDSENPNEKGDLIGPNVAKGSVMYIYLEDRKPVKIVYVKTPDGVLSPAYYKSPKDLYLKNFSWQIEKRPVDKYDIFNWR